MPVGNAEFVLDSSDANDTEGLGVALFECNLEQITDMQIKTTIIMSPRIVATETIQDIRFEMFQK